MSEVSMGNTIVVGLKCMECGLHFQVFSWFQNWPEGTGPTHRSKKEGPFCPECGQNGRFLIQKSTSDKPIFEFVSFGGGPLEFRGKP
jgi:hypothetical protein